MPEIRNPKGNDGHAEMEKPRRSPTEDELASFHAVGGSGPGGTHEQGEQYEHPKYADLVKILCHAADAEGYSGHGISLGDFDIEYLYRELVEVRGIPAQSIYPIIPNDIAEKMRALGEICDR